MSASLPRLALALSLFAFHSSAGAEDALKIAIGQRGGWEQCVSELGQNAGIFKKHGLVLETLYTQGSGETIQIVIAGSVDIGIGPGTHAVFGAFSKGAPIRMIGASFTGARDQLYYVRGELGRSAPSRTRTARRSASQRADRAPTCWLWRWPSISASVSFRPRPETIRRRSPRS